MPQDETLIRPAREADHAQWLPLWRGYQEFYRVSLPEAVTASNWRRFFDPGEPVHCLVAERDGRLVGLAHYLFHRSTWSVENICYLNDLFVDPRGRRSGVARRLIEAVYEAADAAGSSKVYWLTHESNAAARLLYDQVAQYGGFIRYTRS
ncbi:MAG: GNAT family N-acetyltransferase [Rhodospirillaceae bacterium]|jgi:GNAT superfamily N-acetyltransferase|nr:GNAT family N-acetyltransferase [Rhodospirillaceae bacterium]